MPELDHEFMDLVMAFLASSRRIRDAATLCEGDSTKQEMIQAAIKEFHKASARSEALQLMVEKGDYSDNRAFILEELKDLTLLNNEIAHQIELKLKPVVWN